MRLGKRPDTSKKAVLKLISKVRVLILKEISDNARGVYGKGLASEGRAGGYLSALDDVEAALIHGYPSDHSGYWRRAYDDDQ